jgi:hypothetical protein
MWSSYESQPIGEGLKECVVSTHLVEIVYLKTDMHVKAMSGLSKPQFVVLGFLPPTTKVSKLFWSNAILCA